MATNRDFADMLNEYLTYDLLKADYLKRDWLLNNVQRDDGWKGGTLIVPFKGAQASSVKWGGLTDQSDVAIDNYVRGQVTNHREMWGTIEFDHTDLIQHDGRVKEKSFLKVLPDVLDDFLQYVKERASLNMLNGAAANLSADGDASGNATTEHPERFSLKEKVFVDDDNSAVSAAGYIQSIDQNSGVLTLDTTRAGGVDLDISAYTVDQNARLYFDGTEPGTDQGFTSLRSQLLSLANGGSAALFGQTKLDFPYLQAINVDGGEVSDSNMLEQLFNKYVTIRNRAQGRPNALIMSYKNYAAVLKNLEIGKGSFHVANDSKDTSVYSYGWDEITLFGPQGRLKVVAVQEMEDDVIFYLDVKNSIKFHSNGFFRKRVAPDGKSYFELRSATGYRYLVDMMLFGELVLFKPTACGIMHSISFNLE